MKASLHTLGCRLNQAETAIISRSLQDAGYKIVEFGDPADLTVINTCTVTEQADAKCRQAVRKTLRKNPETFVAVVGCYAQMAVDTIRQIDGVDLIVGNEHKIKLVNYLNGLAKKDEPLIVHSPKLSRGDFSVETIGLYDNATRANLKIQDGCNYVCSFCIIPTARGPARSRKFGNIMDEARQLVDLGHQELVLTGVNIGTYNSDGYTIVDVIDKLIQINGLRRLRISSIEPTTIAEEIVHMIAESEKICKHLHIPLQSGDDAVLKSMRRRYTASEFADFIEFVTQTVPDIGIGTDVLVGFPGETDTAFINTKKFLADLPVSYYHVFTYSDRKGTGSNRMNEKVDYHIKKTRTRILIEQGARKKRTFYNRFVGSVCDVLFEQKVDNGNWAGYSSNYMNVEVSSERNLHNRLLPVRLKESDSRALRGILINPEAK
jgi:threonylcarbamoyladenosine tRNA methylthiotransferase MtaB